MGNLCAQTISSSRTRHQPPNLVDNSVLLTLAKRKEGVAAEIVTRHVTETLKLDLERHNRQVPRTVPLPHTAAAALCGVIRMACLRHARGKRATQIRDAAAPAKAIILRKTRPAI